MSIGIDEQRIAEIRHKILLNYFGTVKKSRYVLSVLAENGFLDGTVVDLGCGPSPHVGYRLRAEGFDGSVLFMDWNDINLAIHQDVYRSIQLKQKPLQNAEWRRSDCRDKTAYLEGKNVLVHGTIPRREEHGKLVFPHQDVDEMKRALDDLLSPLPRSLAIFGETKDGVIERALEAMGQKYLRFPNLESAHFLPGWRADLYVVRPNSSS